MLAAAVRRVVGHRFEARTHAAAIAAAVPRVHGLGAFDWVWQVPVLPVAFMLLARRGADAGARRSARG